MTVDLRQALMWDIAKRVLVRHVQKRPLELGELSQRRSACFPNEQDALPELGSRINGILRRPGRVDIFFDDGSVVSAKVNDGSSSCGCSKQAGASSVDMVAAVHQGKLLRALDVHKRGAEDPRMWRYLVQGPVDLFRLHAVPMPLATALADVGSRTSRLHDPVQAWRLAKHHAEPRPFRRIFT